jgi:hypothetical protein
MRSDMYKVIVERPRKGKQPYSHAERFRNDWNGPSFLGMRAGYGRPWLNENLGPLRRFLHAQIGRPWDKVFSEISRNIDRRNTVQQHIHQHLDDFIAIQVEWRDGQLIDLKDGCTWRNRWRQTLYVDPRTGLIRRKPGPSRTEQRREQSTQERQSIEARRRELSDDRWLMRLEDQWYEVHLAPLPQPVYREVVVEGKRRVQRLDRAVFDVVLRERVRSHDFADARKKMYGRWREVYATFKRQLSRRELEAHGLR